MRRTGRGTEESRPKLRPAIDISDKATVTVAPAPWSTVRMEDAPARAPPCARCPRLKRPWRGELGDLLGHGRAARGKRVRRRVVAAPRAEWGPVRRSRRSRGVASSRPSRRVQCGERDHGSGSLQLSSKKSRFPPGAARARSQGRTTERAATTRTRNSSRGCRNTRLRTTWMTRVRLLFL